MSFLDALSCPPARPRLTGTKLQTAKPEMVKNLPIFDTKPTKSISKSQKSNFSISEKTPLFSLQKFLWIFWKFSEILDSNFKTFDLRF